LFATKSSAAGSTNQVTSALGKARLIVSATGKQWITSPIALSLIMSIFKRENRESVMIRNF
jgi:hypothetical protein